MKMLKWDMFNYSLLNILLIILIIDKIIKINFF